MTTTSSITADSAEAPAMRWIRVRDIARGTTHVLPAEREMLRVPYDLFRPTGAVIVEGDMVVYRDGDRERRGRVAASTLADATAGEAVLLRLAENSREPEWWLCEVEEVNGPAAT